MIVQDVLATAGLLFRKEMKKDSMLNGAIATKAQ